MSGTDQLGSQVRTNSEYQVRTNSEYQVRTNSKCQVRTNSECQVRTNSECEVRTNSECQVRTNSEYQVRTNSECQVRTNSLGSMKRPCRSWDDKARPVTAEIRVQCQASVCKILVDDVALEQVFLRVLRLYPVSVIRHCSIHTPFVL
jgi:hypothetical protein